MQDINYRVPGELITKNSTSIILSVQSSRFEQYGQILEGLNVQDLLDKAAEITSIPDEGNIYVPSLKELEVFDGVVLLLPTTIINPSKWVSAMGKIRA